MLTKGQYKQPNSNDGCMWLRAPTTCPGVLEVIEPFAKQQAENAMTGATWNEATKCAAARQVMQTLHTQPRC